jgi:hypothetical protein
MEQTLTHHFIDDQAAPDIDGIEPWDQAMDTIRRHSLFPSQRLFVSEDRRQMTIDLKDLRHAGSYEYIATQVQQSRRLPVEVKRETVREQGVVIFDTLIITYRP